MKGNIYTESELAKKLDDAIGRGGLTVRDRTASRGPLSVSKNEEGDYLWQIMILYTQYKRQRIWD